MRILKLNSHGDDVAKWQQFLTGAGFKPGRVDGFFGDTTAAATIAFQKKHGLTPDGTLGNETLGKAMTLNFKPLPEPEDREPDASPKVVATIARIKVHKLGDGRAVFYTGGMMIDADGAYRAYHPANKGLDFLRNGGKPGNWWALVTENGKPSGTPVVQGPADPAPGFYISTTSLEDPAFNRKNPRRYVDSESIPYIVLPGGKLGGAKLGDYALVINLKTKARVKAIVADSGPKAKLGEASIATAKALLGESKSSPKSGGTEEKIIATSSSRAWAMACPSRPTSSSRGWMDCSPVSAPSKSSPYAAKAPVCTEHWIRLDARQRLGNTPLDDRVSPTNSPYHSLVS